ncbi:MAG: tetratricopeptide repeat protein, partial [Gemmatimonadetes bacterium]|nr:tetratricopeptide repeat protein [Gemmatimonadota bacterium]
RRSIAVQPTPEALANLGAVFGELGDYDAALDAFRQALSIDPAYERARTGERIALDRRSS